LSYSGKFSSMSYSGLSRVSMDPRNKSEDDCSEYMSEDDKRECVLKDDCYKKMSPSMTMMMWILVSSLTMTGTVYAECTPAPDCASIGYTETSCNGGFVRCPFDINKLLCIPCDSSYKYACSGTGEIGSGTACNGKYIECECTDGYELVDGACVISCAYTLTALPTGCSAADSCVKNGTTYYSSTCTTCKSGYTISSGTCKANTCSGYYTSKTGCSNYSTCLSGTTTKYKCSSCNTGYTLNSGQCSANTCDGYDNSIDSNCSSYTTCKSGTMTKYKCTGCSSGYTLCEDSKKCIDTKCYTELTGQGYNCNRISTLCSNGQCTGNNGEVYTIYTVCPPSSGDWS